MIELGRGGAGDVAPLPKENRFVGQATRRGRGGGSPELACADGGPGMA